MNNNQAILFLLSQLAAHDIRHLNVAEPGA